MESQNNSQIQYAFGNINKLNCDVAKQMVKRASEFFKRNEKDTPENKKDFTSL